ncbi:hypothetical protein PF008_g13062 [Phytophthora fragariae]|uniref:Uncharacterized protein n=1 Tax=Phytophthora fragariae TaxID=53985 RepID=A0A6G0RL62_9STRA|nr:hypothetical protein PF008_g13062 [Phytophthora fragariae]
MMSPPMLSNASAVCWSSSFTARCNAVSPVERSWWLMSPPLPTNALNISTVVPPAHAAHIIGVISPSSAIVGSAPCASSTRTTSTRFTRAAQ